MRKLFEGKVVLITGAGSGIGQAASVAYAANGATVIVSGAGISETISMIKSKRSEAFFIEAEIGHPGDCKELIRKIIERYGRLDIAFNNAGISDGSNIPRDASAMCFNRIVTTNLCGIYYCMKYEIKAMHSQGGGIIINSPDIFGNERADSYFGYVAARHGIMGLTQNAALKYANTNIRIHCVSPESANVPLLETIDVKAKTVSSIQHLRAKQGKAAEIAATILWLSSEKQTSLVNGYCTGEISGSSN